MSAILSWPLAVPTFDGVETISRRVLESQPHEVKPEFIRLQVPRGVGLRARFVRQDVVCRLEFRGPDEGRMKLITGSAVSLPQESNYFAIQVDVDAGSLRVGLAFDQQRGHSMRCGTTGTVRGLALSFNENEMERVPKSTLLSFSVGARILSSWSLLTMVALCRYSDTALGQILDHQEALNQESLQMLEDLGRSYQLRPGRGLTGIFLPSGRLDRGDA